MSHGLHSDKGYFFMFHCSHFCAYTTGNQLRISLYVLSLLDVKNNSNKIIDSKSIGFVCLFGGGFLLFFVCFEQSPPPAKRYPQEIHIELWIFYYNNSREQNVSRDCC